MNYGIGNVKGKSSGGAIPTITIELSQMLSANEAQLTNEQFEIIANNSFISVALPTGQVWGFNRVQDDYGNYHLALCVGSSTEISYTTGDIDSTTKIITISMGDFSGGKQLYLHRIRCRNTGATGDIIVTIISDKSTAYTTDEMTQYLESVDADNVAKCYPASGYVRVNSIYYYLCGVRADKASSSHITNAVYLLADGSNYAEIKITIYGTNYTPIPL